VEEKEANLSPLNDLMDLVTGAKGNKSSWPVTLFLVAGLVIVASIFGIQMALQKRKAAELVAKYREELEKERQARENEKLAQNDVERAAAKKAIEEAQKNYESLTKSVDDLAKAHEEKVKELSSITSWDDIVVIDSRKPV